jgi:hypothetical protein
MLAAAVLGLALFGAWASRWSVPSLAGAGAAAAALGLACALAVRRVPRPAAAGAAVAVLGCGALLAAPAGDAAHVIRAHLSDSGHPGAMPPARVRRLSAFLRGNQAGARYEFASAAATQAGPLIAHDGRPVVVLTSFDGRVLVGPSRLERLAAAGAVRYVLLGGSCHTGHMRLAVCRGAARWTRSHGVDVSRAAGTYRGLVWDISPRAETKAAAAR